MQENICNTVQLHPIKKNLIEHLIYTKVWAKQVIIQ